VEGIKGESHRSVTTEDIENSHQIFGSKVMLKNLQNRFVRNTILGTNRNGGKITIDKVNNLFVTT
jgi:hypothetical protein